MTIHNPFDYTNAVIDTQSLSNSEKLVALVIARHFNWVDLDPAFPTNETIANKCGLTSRTVITAKNGLIEKGWLSSERRYNKSNFYTPSIPRSDTMSPQDTEGETISPLETDSETISPLTCNDFTSRREINNTLTNKVTNNNNNNEIKESEGISLDEINNYINSNITLDILKEQLDKEDYLLVAQGRSKNGIFK